MPTPDTTKRLAIIHSHLLSAHKYLNAVVDTNVPLKPIALGSVEAELADGSLVALFEKLVEAGLKELPRGGFWRDLERAAEAMGNRTQELAMREAFQRATRNYADA